MSLYTVEMTPEHLTEIMDNLWDVSASELDEFGPVDLGSAISSDWHYALLDENDRPVCVFGANRSGDSARTWFLASRNFHAHAHEITRIVRKTIKNKAKSAGVTKVMAASASRHPMVGNWFRLIGFWPEGKVKFGRGVAVQYVMKR